MNKPVAWMYAVNGIWTAFSDELPPDDAYDEGTLTPLYTHPVKEQSNLVNVVKDHIEDLWRCVKTFRSYEMDNTADEMEVAIKELEDAIQAHPVELTDEEIKQIFVEESGFDVDTCPIAIMDFAKAILRKANEK